MMMVGLLLPQPVLGLIGLVNGDQARGYLVAMAMISIAGRTSTICLGVRCKCLITHSYLTAGQDGHL